MPSAYKGRSKKIKADPLLSHVNAASSCPVFSDISDVTKRDEAGRRVISYWFSALVR